MASSNGFSMKPHAVCLPAPTQSHIGAMLKLAKLLHHRGLCITFVNTEFNHRRLLEARGSSFLQDLPAGFQFVEIPDGLPSSKANATQSVVSLCESAKLYMGAPFYALIEDLNKRASSGSGFPPVSCIVADGLMTFSAYPASEKFGIPVVNLWTIPACALMGLLHYPKLKEKGLTPLKDESYLTNGFLETKIDWIPGMTNMRLHDMPSFFRTTDPDDFVFHFMMDTTARFDKASATIIHTFEPLEADVLSALSSMFSRTVYAIGPFQLLIDRILENGNHLKHMGCSLWKEDVECLEWLDSQKPESVLYINFGSITFLTSQQLVEFAMGIANSKHPFLWIIRPDLVDGDTAVLPPEFTNETKGRAFITEWCPQEEVLNHPSVGGFLTHCGWNSVIESLSAEVPMLCWPYFADQQTICKYACTDWEVGLEIGSDVNQDEVERLVKELIEGEKGKQMKKRATEWKRLAFMATREEGSSSTNLGEIISYIISK
ncbi:7-deoxyloganetin glucosyltransferase-like isoform X1 [Punica granatum]|uniref:Glycosyltransferase n=1 Tax=Punica granatum TaxID=22663 RepID=A0A6P8ENL3_PUNGR|nr:7-deoxyloganetin glucosyltransferase-like isoform X1 [Punica granatum]